MGMATDRQSKYLRKSVFIMFTDIVGYTALMNDNEEYALQMIHVYEQTVRNCTEKYGGEVINFYGDGSLAVYESVDDALDCALEIQLKFTEDSPIPLRIGIHRGEVIFENNNAYGDAVNIASRIESLGQEGAVMLSEAVKELIQIESKFETCFLGAFDFKNVKGAMNIYALVAEGLRIPESKTITGKLKKAQEEPHGRSVAVIPFVNITEDDSVDYMVEGIADEIRSQLLGIDSIQVISRSSSNHYKNKDYQLKDILDHLDAHYVLEGRVQFDSEHVVLHTELSNTLTDHQLWAFSSEPTDLNSIFGLQNEVALAVASELRIIMSDVELGELQKIPTTNPEALKFYQKGMSVLHRGYGKIEELNEALLLFDQALKEDPNFTKAIIAKADTYLEFLFWGRRSPKEVLQLSQETIEKALEQDPDNVDAKGTLGALYFFRMKDKDLAIKTLKEVIEQSPSNLSAYEKLAWIYISGAQFDDAHKMFEITQKLDPLSTKYKGDLAQVYYYKGEYEKGITYLKALLSSAENDPWFLWVYGYLLSAAGRYDEAEQILCSRSTSGKYSNWLLGYIYGKQGKIDKAEVILDLHLNRRKLDFVPAYMIATIYMGLGQLDKAVEWLEQDFEDGGQGLFFTNLKHDPKFVELHGNERFDKLVKAGEF